MKGRAHALRYLGSLLEVRVAAGCGAQSSAVLIDNCTIQSTPINGGRVGYDGAKKRKGFKVHSSVATLGHLLALQVSLADAHHRARVDHLALEVQVATGQSVELAYVNVGYTDIETAAVAQAHGIALHVVKSYLPRQARLRSASSLLGRQAFPPSGSRL